MDSVSLREERSRVSNHLSAKLAELAALRARLANTKTDAGRRFLYDVADKQADRCRELSAQLIALDDLIGTVQSHLRLDEQGPLMRKRPLETAPLDF